MLSRVELFEHETVRVGHPLRVVEGPPAVLTDNSLEALARYNDENGGDLFRLGHRKISFTQHVGYVEVENLAIEILPKADRGSLRAGEPRIWRDALLHMLRVAAGVELRSYSPASQETGNTTLLELVVARFLDEVERLQHQGLSKGYRETQQNSSAFRGRLVAQENLRTNLVRPDRFYVRFCTYDVDILINRIISKALEVAASLALSSSSAARVAACRLAFPEVSGVQATQETFERLRLHRGTVRYASALHTARLILTRNSPRLRSGRVPVFALLFDMNSLWERYMGVMFRRAAGHDFHVSTQESRGFWKQSTKRARTIRPDIVVRAGPHVVLVADAKWKVPVEGAPADADLKQMFAYNELFTSARAVLVYPAVDGRVGYAGGFIGRTHVCETLHVGGATETDPAWSAQVVQAQIRRAIEQIAA
jgi:5-methylcytosine-specific restriction enzyme subunit McrC